MINRFSFVVFFILVATILIAPVVPVWAQVTKPPSGLADGFDEVEAVESASGIKPYAGVGDFVLAILGVVGTFVAVLALAALIYGAVMYIISFGDEGKTSTAKKIILYAIVGLLVLGAAGIIVNVVINFIKK